MRWWDGRGHDDRVPEAISGWMVAILVGVFLAVLLTPTWGQDFLLPPPGDNVSSVILDLRPLQRAADRITDFATHNAFLNELARTSQLLWAQAPNTAVSWVTVGPRPISSPIANEAVNYWLMREGSTAVDIVFKRSVVMDITRAINAHGPRAERIRRDIVESIEHNVRAGRSVRFVKKYKGGISEVALESVAKITGLDGNLLRLFSPNLMTHKNVPVVPHPAPAKGHAILKTFTSSRPFFYAMGGLFKAIVTSGLFFLDAIDIYAAAMTEAGEQEITDYLDSEDMEKFFPCGGPPLYIPCDDPPEAEDEGEPSRDEILDELQAAVDDLKAALNDFSGGYIGADGIIRPGLRPMPPLPPLPPLPSIPSLRPGTPTNPIIFPAQIEIVPGVWADRIIEVDRSDVQDALDQAASDWVQKEAYNREMNEMELQDYDDHVVETWGPEYWDNVDKPARSNEDDCECGEDAEGNCVSCQSALPHHLGREWIRATLERVPAGRDSLGRP